MSWLSVSITMNIVLYLLGAYIMEDAVVRKIRHLMQGIGAELSTARAVEITVLWPYYALKDVFSKREEDIDAGS